MVSNADDALRAFGEDIAVVAKRQFIYVGDAEKRGCLVSVDLVEMVALSLEEVA